MTKTQLENLFFNENIQVMNPSNGQVETYCIPLDQRIYVLEDVDCQSDIVMERALKNDSGEENKKKRDAFAKEMEDKHKVDLSFLLNLLDGVLENPGRIVIMTSNFPDTLDSALIRPGRIDVIAKFRNCSNKTVKEMVEFFYDIQLSGEEMERISQLKEEIVTPAELSKVMFENFSDYQASIQHMENLSIKRVEEEMSKMQEQSLPEPITVYGEPTSNDSNAQTVTVDYSNKEVGFSEQKGDISNERESEKGESGYVTQPENKFSLDDRGRKSDVGETYGGDRRSKPYTTVRRRIEEDITYVFINIIVDRNVKREKINRKWEDYNYYSNLLQTYVFKLNEYVHLVEDCASNCKEVVEHADNLKTQKESPNTKAISRQNIVIYEAKLYQFFNPTLMMVSGLREQMVKDGMIDSTEFQYAFDSQLNSSSLNTTSFSAY
jgi:SpoVK/Ycf46/Vps4 family AAA+-type ATPase